MSQGEAEEFAIPLQRPYGPLVVILAILTPVAVWSIWQPGIRAKSSWGLPLIGVALLGFALAFSWALLALARTPRFSIWATGEALYLPRLFSSRVARVPWAAISLIRLDGNFNLVVQVKNRALKIPRQWLRTRQKAQTAAAALDERLQLARRQAGARLAH